MMSFLIAYGVVVVSFLVIDYIWLGILMKDFLHNQLGHLMVDEVNFGIAALFYLFYATGIVVFAVNPALSGGGWMKAALLGGFLGFLAYGTYDVTNAATLKDWPMLMSVIDVAWGTTLTAFTATLGYFVTKMVIS